MAFFGRTGASNIRPIACRAAYQPSNLYGTLYLIPLANSLTQNRVIIHAQLNKSKLAKTDWHFITVIFSCITEFSFWDFESILKRIYYQNYRHEVYSFLAQPIHCSRARVQMSIARVLFCIKNQKKVNFIFLFACSLCTASFIKTGHWDINPKPKSACITRFYSLPSNKGGAIRRRLCII